MGDRWQPTSGDEWFKVTDKRLNILERRTRGGAVGAGGGASTVTRVGSDGGVYVLQGGVEVGPFPPAQHYLPTPGDVVWLEQVGPDVVVAGAVSDVTLLTAARPQAISYSRNSTDDNWEELSVTVRNGFAHVTGLVAMATVTPGTVITTLPPHARPDTEMLFVCDNSGIGRSLYVRADGQIRLGASFTANGYVSLSNIIFPVAGRAQWIEVPPADFRNGWTDFTAGGGATNFGKARYWKDEFGVAWGAGMTKGGSTVNNTTMFVVPPGYGGPVNEQQHVATTSQEALGFIYPNSDNAIGYGAGGGGNQWQSLAARWQTDQSKAGLSWLNFGPGGDASIGAGWGNYGGNFPRLGIAQRGDGMVLTKGLISNGSVGPGAALLYLSDSMRRKRSFILTVVAQAAHGRLDVQGHEKAAGGYAIQGALSPTAGSNIWFSLDGKAWFPE